MCRDETTVVAGAWEGAAGGLAHGWGRGGGGGASYGAPAAAMGMGSHAVQSVCTAGNTAILVRGWGGGMSEGYQGTCLA